MTTDSQIASALTQFDTWSKALDGWVASLRAGGLSPRTIYQRQWQLRTLAAAHPGRSPWNLSADDLVAWMAGHDGWSPETLKSWRAAFRSFYGWALDTGRTERDPSRALRRVRVPPGLPRPASDLTVTRALDRADQRTRLMILLGALAGLRASEIAGLRWDNLHDGRLLVQGKGGRVRRIPAHPDLAAELEAWRDGGARAYRYHADSDVWVLPGQTPGGLHPRMVSGALSRALGPGVVGHQLRHRFATRAYGADRDLLAVQQLLGHSDPATTSVYAQLPDGALERAVAAAG